MHAEARKPETESSENPKWVVATPDTDLNTAYKKLMFALDSINESSPSDRMKVRVAVNKLLKRFPEEEKVVATGFTFNLQRKRIEANLKILDKGIYTFMMSESFA